MGEEVCPPMSRLVRFVYKIDDLIYKTFFIVWMSSKRIWKNILTLLKVARSTDKLKNKKSNQNCPRVPACQKCLNWTSIQNSNAAIPLLPNFLQTREYCFNSHAVGMVVAQPSDFEIDFARNPISGSAAWFFVSNLKFILTVIFEIENHVKEFFGTKKIPTAWELNLKVHHRSDDLYAAWLKTCMNKIIKNVSLLCYIEFIFLIYGSEEIPRKNFWLTSGDWMKFLKK